MEGHEQEWREAHQYGEGQADEDVVRTLRNLVHGLNDRPANIQGRQLYLLALVSLPDNAGD